MDLRVCVNISSLYNVPNLRSARYTLQKSAAEPPACSRLIFAALAEFRRHSHRLQARLHIMRTSGEGSRGSCRDAERRNGPVGRGRRRTALRLDVASVGEDSPPHSRSLLFCRRIDRKSVPTCPIYYPRNKNKKECQGRCYEKCLFHFLRPATFSCAIESSPRASKLTTLLVNPSHKREKRSSKHQNNGAPLGT